MIALKPEAKWPSIALLALLLVLGAMGPGAISVHADEGLWAWEVRSQGTIDARPGNDYFYGPTLSYSNWYLFSHKLQLQATWLTNRPEAAWRPGVPVQDWYLISPLWHSNRNGFFDPVFRLDWGFTWFDTEGLDIPHTDYILAPAIGMNLNLGQGRYGIEYMVGFQTHASSLVNPGLATLSVWGMF